MLVERVVMFVVMLGSKNTRGSTLCSHGHTSCILCEAGSTGTLTPFFIKGHI